MVELVYPTNEFLHFQNYLAAVVEHADGYISIDWKPAPMRTSDLREVYNQALELLVATRFGCILTDHAMMTPLLPPDQQWLIHEWVPQAIKRGNYQRCAIIRSQDPLSRQATQQVVVQLTEVPLTIRYFDDRPTAVAWLLTD